MKTKHIILDPGHGGTMAKDHFRQGPSSEREEWINLRVCKALKLELEAKGYIVSLTRRQDVEVGLQARVDFAKINNADLFVSVHHASCDPVDPELNFPFMYMHNTLNTEDKNKLALCFKNEMSNAGRGEAFVYSDHWVFESGLFILKELEAINIPAILTEFSFFSHPEEEKRLKDMECCRVEANILAKAVHSYFTSSKTFKVTASVFPFEYMRQLNIIKKSILENNKDISWHKFYLQAQKLSQTGNYQEALINYERALAINPYHPNIIKQLEIMYVYSQNLNLIEHSQNINQLQESIY